MVRSTKVVVLILVVVGLGAFPGFSAPDEPLNFHDPSIVREGDVYYIFSTGPGLLVRRSEDLVHWEDIGPVFREVPAWARKVVPNQKDLWAPDVATFGGRHHLYYAISRFGTNRSAIGHATIDAIDPALSDWQWRDEGMVIESHPGRTDWNAIDAHVAFDEKRDPWLFWGSFFSGIKVARLDAKTGKLKKGARILPVAARPHAKALEAPYVVRRDGFHYLFLSFDLCCRGAASNYRIVVGRSGRIEGPYVDRDGRALLSGGGTPVLSGGPRWRGPGHNSVLLREEGDLLVHHAYDAHGQGKPRLRIRPLVWMPDGWPLVGEVEDRERWHAEGESPSAAGAWMHSVDFKELTRIVFREDGRIGSSDATAEWVSKDGLITLKWPRADGPDGVWVDSCVLSPDGCRYLGRNQRGMIVRGWKLADAAEGRDR